MRIYSKPNSYQREEKLFQEYLFKGFTELQHVNETYTLSDNEFLNPFIDIRQIEKLLHNDKILSKNKRIAVLNILKGLPNKLRVAEKNHLVSVDFLIIDNKNMRKYIEFHEIQHRGLSVNRPTPIYDKEFNKFEIPRYVQRFLKDIWRYENLPNFKIIWFDWFTANPNHDIVELINSDRNEFAKEGQFTFSKLMQKNIK